MDSILLSIAQALGISPITMTLYLGILVAACNIIGKSIPESATGPLAVVRKICKVIGLYVPNKVTPIVSTETVAKAIAATAPDSAIRQAAECLPAAIESGTSAGVLAREVLDAAGGMRAGRPYVPGDSPEQGSEVPEEYRTDPFAAGAAKRREAGE